jgi:hypothetical protein
MDSEPIEQLAAYSVPQPLTIHGDDGREQRNWVVRLAGSIPGESNLDDLSAKLSRTAVSAVTEARALRGLPVENAEPHMPLVRVLAVDAQHLIVNICTIKLEKDDVHAYLVAASAVLKGLHDAIAIEDVQGIPRRFWRLLIGE